jgi:Putative Ig domain
MRWIVVGAAIGALCSGCGQSEPPAATPAASQDFGPTAVNRAPIVESVRIDPAEPARGALLRAVVTARDPDGQSVTLTHHWFLDGAEQATSDASFPLDGVDEGAEIRVSVSASDGELESEAAAASVRVTGRPPQLGAAVLEPAGSVMAGQPLVVRTNVMDPDGDPVDLEYAWYVNDELRADTGSVFSTAGLKNGDSIYAEVRAKDGSTVTDPQRTPAVKVDGTNPEITSTPPGFREDGQFRYQVVAVDPNGDKRLRYSLETGPDGMVIDNVLGGVTWTPHDVKPGVYPVVVVVRDSRGLETKQSFSVTVQQRTAASVPATPDTEIGSEPAPNERHHRHTRPASPQASPPAESTEE